MVHQSADDVLAGWWKNKLEPDPNQLFLSTDFVVVMPRQAKDDGGKSQKGLLSRLLQGLIKERDVLAQ